MRKLIPLLALCFVTATHAATRTTVAGGNWNVSGTWDSGIPTISDVAVIDGHSITVSTASATAYVCTQLTINASSELIVTNGGTIVVATNFWVDPTATFPIIAGKAGTNWTLSITGKGADGNGCTLTSAVSICHLSAVQPGGTNTIFGTLSVTNTTLGNNTVTTINGGFIDIYGNRTDTSWTKGTCVVTLRGTGTWAGNATSGRGTSLTNVVDTTGTITFASTGPNFGGTNILLAGTLNYGTSTCYLQSNSKFVGRWPFYNLTVVAACSNNWDSTDLFVSNLYSVGDFTVNHIGPTAWTNGAMTLGGGTHYLPCDVDVLGTVTITTGDAAILTNTYNVTCGELVVNLSSTATTLNKQAGTTMIVTNRLTFYKGAFLRSSVASSPFTLQFTGPYTNREVCGVSMTDVNFVGNPPTLFNYWGTTNRCTGIVPHYGNKTTAAGN